MDFTFFAQPWLIFGLAVVLMVSFGAISALLINRATVRVDAANRDRLETTDMLVALDDGNQWALFIGKNGKIKTANQAFCAATGFSTTQVSKADPIKIFESSCRDINSITRLKAGMQGGQAIRVQMRLRNPITGDMHWWLVTGRPWLDKSRQVKGYWMLGIDISQEKAHEDELHQLAYTDALTGLANRQWMIKQLTDVQMRKDSRGLYFVTFPRLKQLVSSLNREQADLVIVTVASRLQQSLTPYQSAARLDSTSFAVLERDTPLTNNVDSAEQLGRQLAKSFDIIDHEIQLLPAIGIAYAEHQRDAQDWLANAELAARALHIRNKPLVGVYMPEVRAQMAHKRSLEFDLRRAIYFAPEQLYPSYQPIYRLADQKLMGFEMLARWEHPIHGNIPPLDFIPVAEESGLITALWVHLFAQAARQLKKWQVRNPHLFLSVNLSAHQFALPGLLKTVDTLTEITGIKPASIKLEITETEMMDDPEAALEQMNALKTRGYSISIDDFGTGFSSLSYLHRLPISDVKIDRSFVKSMHDNVANMEIINMIAQLGRRLGHTTTAEGIETAADYEMLKRLGCTLGQGYYFARPMVANDIGAVLQKLEPTFSV